MFDDFGLGDLGSVSSDSIGMPSVDVVPAGGYDAGALGQYFDTSQGMPTYTPDYGATYDNVGSGGVLSGLVGGTDSAPSGGYSTKGLSFANSQGTPQSSSSSSEPMGPPRSAMDQQSTAMKLIHAPATSDGTATDWTDPKTITALLKALSVGGTFVSQLLNHGKTGQSAAQLQGTLAAQNNNAWNPIQAARANAFFNSQYTPTWQRPQMNTNGVPLVASRGYAVGGDVQGGGPGDGDATGPLGLVATDGTGQADDVKVNLSGGEYVTPADAVSALGDGNNAAGAKVMDKWVQAIRERARSTAPTDNPPPALSPDQYLGGGEQ